MSAASSSDSDAESTTSSSAAAAAAAASGSAAGSGAGHHHGTSASSRTSSWSRSRAARSSRSAGKASSRRRVLHCLLPAAAAFADDAARVALETSATVDGRPLAGVHVHGAPGPWLLMNPAYQRDVHNTPASWAVFAGMWALLPVHAAFTTVADQHERLHNEHLLGSDGLRFLQSLRLDADTQLRELVLDHLNLGDAAAVLLAAFLRVNPCLKTFKVLSSTRPMTTRGLAALSSAIRASPAPLRRVYVEGVTMRSVGKLSFPVIEAPPPTLVLSSPESGIPPHRRHSSSLLRTSHAGSLSASASGASLPRTSSAVSNSLPSTSSFGSMTTPHGGSSLRLS